MQAESGLTANTSAPHAGLEHGLGVPQFGEAKTLVKLDECGRHVEARRRGAGLADVVGLGRVVFLE